jgi:rhodanese-related sulfurtransferase
MNVKHRKWFGLLVVVTASPLMAQAQQAAPPAAAAAAAQAAKATQVALVSQDALLAMQARKDASLLLLDVRTPDEYAAGHVPGAVNIPYDKVATHLAEIPKDDEVVLYCHSGRRAGLAAEVLAANGYTRLAHLEGDMQGWQGAGRPVETGPARVVEKK